LKASDFDFGIPAKTRDFKVPDYKSKDFRDAFIKSLIRIEESIIAEIRTMAGDDESEITRIKSAVNGSWDELETNDRAFFEFALSIALITCRTSAYHFENGDLLHAFKRLIDAGAYLGNACGNDTAVSKNILKKKAIQLRAEDKRHRENREIKQEAIAFYKTKYAEKINKLEKNGRGKAKDDAAVEIMKQCPISFRTARGYIDEYHRENTPS
jgi:hypothetical protein